MDILPQKVANKIVKTGMTRGAEDDEAFQNRVNRNNTVLIRLSMWERYAYLHTPDLFERSFIVLIPPSKISELEKFPDLSLGKNALVFYETRHDWETYPKRKAWKPASERPWENGKLGGQYIARVPALPTEGKSGEKIFQGYCSTKKKGAGIRFYEYANTATLQKTKLQLTVLYLKCWDVVEVLREEGHSDEEITEYIDSKFTEAREAGLLDLDKLKAARIINEEEHTICPLCLKPISARGFADTMTQSEGREVTDVTVTEVSLFHIDELKASSLNHKPYNLGWGHHFCNVVTKDAGISATLDWMRGVLCDNGFQVTTKGAE